MGQMRLKIATDIKPNNLIRALYKTEMVCPVKLQEARGVILVSVSGGSDSDIVVDLVERHKGDANVKYVWFNTGLEYEATKRHLIYLENRYGIQIERMNAVMPVPLACKKNGVPFLSKDASQKIYRLQKHGFKWEDKPFDELLKEYPNCKSALKWWCGDRRKSVTNHAYLKEFMMKNPPDFLISDYCCTGAKKRTYKLAVKKYKAVLNLTGMRQAEGGVRATTIKSCFMPATDNHIAEYHPLFFFTDKDKRQYEQEHDIKHSDCYNVYGMKRTGCAACPFGSGFEEELKIIEMFEPKLFKAANAIFGKSYEYTRKYREYKERRKKEAREAKKQCKGQLSLTDWQANK